MTERLVPLSKEKSSTHEVPHAKAVEEIGDLAVMMSAGEIPGFTIDPTLFADHDATQAFVAVADAFPDHTLHDNIMHIGTHSGPTEIPHTDREDTFPSGSRDSFRLHRIEPTSEAGAYVALGNVDGLQEIPAATVFDVDSEDPDAHAVEYYKTHVAPGTVTVFDATKFHQWVNDKDDAYRGNHIADIVRNKNQ